MYSSLVIVTLGHGPFFSESADASVRLGLLHASFLLHHPSDRSLTKGGILSRYVTPTSWASWGLGDICDPFHRFYVYNLGHIRTAKKISR